MDIPELSPGTPGPSTPTELRPTGLPAQTPEPCVHPGKLWGSGHLLSHPLAPSSPTSLCLEPGVVVCGGEQFSFLSRLASFRATQEKDIDL